MHIQTDPCDRVYPTLFLVSLDQAIRLYRINGYYINELEAYQSPDEIIANGFSSKDYDGPETETIHLDPQVTNAYYNRGLSYYQLGQYERAIQDLDEAIRLHCKHLYYEYDFHYEEGFRSLMIPWAKDIRLDQYTNTYYVRGLSYYQLGQYERAIQDYDEVIIFIDFQLARAYLGRSIAYQAIGKSEEAEQDLAKSRELGFPTLS